MAKENERMYLEKRRREDSLQKAKERIEKNPNDLDAYGHAISACYWLGRDDEANKFEGEYYNRKNQKRER